MVATPEGIHMAAHTNPHGVNTNSGSSSGLCNALYARKRNDVRKTTADL